MRYTSDFGILHIYEWGVTSVVRLHPNDDPEKRNVIKLANFQFNIILKE